MTARASTRDGATRLTRQLSLDLPPAKRRGRGGARPGAGRPRKTDEKRTFIAHRTRPSHRKDDPVHVTLRITPKVWGQKPIPSLRSQLLEPIVRGALLQQRAYLDEKWGVERKHFQVVDFTIQADHLHLVVEAPHKSALARGVAGIEVRIARRVNAALKRKGKFWKERYHRRDLRTKAEVRNVLRYVLLNSQKHIRHFGDRALADPFTSAPSFDGFAGRVHVFPEKQPWPRVRPRTWLLRVGWRHRGLIDPTEPPTSSPFRARTT